MVQHRIIKVICAVLNSIDFDLELIDLLFKHVVLCLADFELLVEVLGPRAALRMLGLKLGTSVCHLLVFLSEIIDSCIDLHAVLQVRLHLFVGFSQLSDIYLG